MMKNGGTPAAGGRRKNVPEGFAKKAPVFSGEKEWMERNDKELENEEMQRKAEKGGEMRNDLTEPELSGLSQGGLMKRLAEAEYPEKILESAQPFMELMSRYRCAMMEVETKLRVLDEEFSMTYDRNPFETIKSRLKRPVSIIAVSYTHLSFAAAMHSSSVASRRP